MKKFQRCTGSGAAPVREHDLGCPMCPARFATFPPGEGGVVPEHAMRAEPSAVYYPRIVDLHTSPLLAGCAKAGFTEEQTIDMLAKRVRELEDDVQRLTLAQPMPTTYVATARGKAPTS